MELSDLSVKYQLEESLPSAKELKITTQDEYKQVSDYLVTYRKLIKMIKEKFAPSKKKASEAHKEICEWEKTELAVAEKNEKLAISMLTTWREKEERERLAEQERQNAESKRMAEKQQKELLESAAKLEASGDKEFANEVLQTATEIKAPVYTVTANTEKTERTASGTTSWIPEWNVVSVNDPMQVILAICGGLLPIDCIEVREGRIKAWAKSNNVASGEYHGCKIVKTERPAVR